MFWSKHHNIRGIFGVDFREIATFWSLQTDFTPIIGVMSFAKIGYGLPSLATFAETPKHPHGGLRDPHEAKWPIIACFRKHPKKKFQGCQKPLLYVSIWSLYGLFFPPYMAPNDVFTFSRLGGKERGANFVCAPARRPPFSEGFWPFWAPFLRFRMGR